MFYINMENVHGVCRFCLQVINEPNNCSELENAANMFLSDLLQKCIPDVDLNLVNKAFICHPCLESLEDYNTFFIDSQKVEEKVNYFCDYTDTNKYPVNIYEVLQFTTIVKKETSLENTFEINHSLGVKTDEDIFKENKILIDTTDDTDFKYDIKIEDVTLEIKSENQGTNELQHISQTDDQSNHIKAGKKYVEITSKLYECLLCEYKTNWKSYLTRHSLVHKSLDEVELFECQQCNYKSKFKTHLKRHLLVHMNPDKLILHKCEICSFSTKCKQGLLRHNLIHKDPADLILFTCDRCDFKAKHKYILRRHVLLHNNQDLECATCPFKTYSKINLAKHSLVHKSSTEAELLECNKCNFKSNDKNYLKAHLLLHISPDKLVLYKCDKCTYSSKFKHSLQRHNLVHLDPEKLTLFECEQCDYKTKYHDCLKGHMLLHNTTNYQCDNCNFKTHSMSNLAKHKLSHKNLTNKE